MTSRRTTRGRAAAVAGALVAAGCVWASPAVAAPTCFGQRVTVSGTGGDDVVTGTAGDDVIATWGGDDVVAGRGGKDRICAGGGDDRVDAGGDDDRAAGGEGRDRLLGAGGRDALRGASGRDRVAGGIGSDDLVAGAGADDVRGDAGDDRLLGGPGDDDLRGGDGDDQFGEADPGYGDPEHPSSGRGDDALRGGRGHDTISVLHAPVPAVVDLAAGTATGDGDDTLAGIDGAGGSLHADLLLGDAGRNWLDGWTGADVVRGRGGDDWVASGEELYGGAGNDTAFAHGTRDVHGGPGVDWADFLCDGRMDELDLAAGTSNVGVLTGIENARGPHFNPSELAGDDGPNVLAAGYSSDENVLAGRGGDDELHGGTPYTVVNHGDTGDGGDGTDLCVDVEFPSNCEEVRARRAASGAVAGPPASSGGRALPPTRCAFHA